MNYKGKELKEFKSDKPIVFDPPKKMLVWDDDDDDAVIPDDPVLVCAYIPTREMKVITSHASWQHCAEIPKESKSRRATNLELAKWLAQGNGEKSYALANGATCSVSCDFNFIYSRGQEDRPLREHLVVRKWGDNEWHEPTIDYMGLAK